MFQIIKLKKNLPKGVKREFHSGKFTFIIKLIFSFYEFLVGIFGNDYNKRISKQIPQIQMDRKIDQMRTWKMTRKVINPVLTKRIICDDKITTLPLKRANGNFI